MSNTPKIGDRIRLIFMPNDPDPVPAGSLGTIIAVHPYHRWTQVVVDWDNGRSLMLTMPGDLIEILGPEGIQS
jgi:hypothetical protein